LVQKIGLVRRYLKPAAAAVGVQIGGWHDFRHTLSRTLRRAGVHPVVIKDTLGHSKVDLAMNVYDKASAEDIRAGLRVVSKKLLGSGLLPKDLLPTTPKHGESDESAAVAGGRRDSLEEPYCDKLGECPACSHEAACDY
jgi:hypothetical protein